MIFLSALLAVCIGAFVGKFMAITVHYLPQILLEGCDKGREPRDIFKWFFQKPLCLNCHHDISWLENMPIAGYLITKGKCPHCQHASGRQVFWLELGVALLFGVTALIFGLDAAALFVLVATCLLICCFITDFEYGILPDQFTLSLIWVGLIGSLNPIFIPPQEAILGAIGGYLVFWAINEIYRYFRNFDGMFPGDFKLNAGLGACIGFKLLLPVLVISLLLLVVVAIMRILWLQRLPEAGDMHKEIAYACYVTIVAVMVLYLKLSGIIA